jgi:hypothetical protein
MEFGIDLISDLAVGPEDEFSWAGRATSLFCAVAGGVSSDLPTVGRVLADLGNHYRGVFYIDGGLEHSDPTDAYNTVKTLQDITAPLSNVIYLHNHIVVLNRVAFLAVNGWYNNVDVLNTVDALDVISEHKLNDLSYLNSSVGKLQRHQDVEQIVMISGSVPSKHFFYNSLDSLIEADPEPNLGVLNDTEFKIKTWLYGGTSIENDTQYSSPYDGRSRRYVSHPKLGSGPYWARRVNVQFAV